MFAGEHDAFQIHVDDRVPKFLVHVSHRAGAANSHIVDQDVQSPITFRCGPGHFLAVGVNGHAADHHRCLPSVFLDSRQRDLGVLLLPVYKQYLRALFGEEYRRGLTYAHKVTAAGGPGAGDDGHLALQPVSRF